MNETDSKQKAREDLVNSLEIFPEHVQNSILLILQHLSENAGRYKAVQKRADLCAESIEGMEKRVENLERMVGTGKIPQKNNLMKVGRYSIYSFLQEKFPDLYKNLAGFSILSGKIAGTGIVPFQEDSFKRSHYHFSADNQEIIEEIHKYLIENIKVGRKRTELPKSLINLMNPPVQTPEIRLDEERKEENRGEISANETEEYNVKYVTNSYLFRGLEIDPRGTGNFEFGRIKDKYGIFLKSVKIPGTNIFGYLKTDVDQCIEKYLESKKQERELTAVSG